MLNVKCRMSQKNYITYHSFIGLFVYLCIRHETQYFYITNFIFHTDMKKIIIAIMAVVMALPACAQYDMYREQGNGYQSFKERYNLYYGLRLGLAVSSVHSDDPTLDGGGNQAGLNLGGVIGVNLSPTTPISLETGLFFTEKGGKGVIDGVKFTFDLNYLEIPITAKYRYELNEDFSIQPFFGGYFAFGVGGKVKNYKERESCSSFSDDYFKRFDGGLRIGCGAEYSMIYAEAAYEFGLSNICHSDFDSSRNGCFYINCGINF